MSHPTESSETRKQSAGTRSKAGRHYRSGDAERSSRKGATSKAPPPRTIRDLIEYAYALKGKQLRLSQKAAQDIDESSHSDRPAEHELPQRLAELIASDPLLAVPPRLIIGLEDAHAPVPLRLRIASMLESSLRSHPLLVPATENKSNTGLGPVPVGQLDVETVFQRIRLRTPEITAASIGLENNSLKQAERDRLRVNATTSVALITATIEGWSLERLVECLERHLWRGALTKPRAPLPLVAIMESSSLEALGTVAEVFQKRVQKADRAALAAANVAAEAEARIRNVLDRANAVEEESARLRSVADSHRNEIAILQGRIQALQGQIDEQKRDRVIDQSHHIDDFEDLRTRIIRSLSKQVDLLSDGLHAVRNQSYSVTEEFIERSLESLSKELRQLNDEGMADDSRL